MLGVRHRAGLPYWAPSSLQLPPTHTQGLKTLILQGLTGPDPLCFQVFFRLILAEQRPGNKYTKPGCTLELMPTLRAQKALPQDSAQRSLPGELSRLPQPNPGIPAPLCLPLALSTL